LRVQIPPPGHLEWFSTFKIRSKIAQNFIHLGIAAILYNFALNFSLYFDTSIYGTQKGAFIQKQDAPPSLAEIFREGSFFHVLWTPGKVPNTSRRYQEYNLISGFSLMENVKKMILSALAL